jgi:BASS family bile acid:Na+ symporter
VTSQSSQAVLINGFGVLFVILNALGLGLRIPFGKVLAQAGSHWEILVWALVINFVIIPLLFIGYLLTIASSIPDEIKVGFCVAALSAGMPFAPILAQLAKANVSVATTMLVVLTLGTIIALPIGLPLAIDAVDAHLKTSAWDVAWPLLLFLLLPLLLGCAFRVWWSDLTPPLEKWAVQVAVLCLLLNANFTLVAYWNCSWTNGAPRVTSRRLLAHLSASGAAISSFPVFESKMWEPGTRPRRQQRCATSLRCS